MVAIARYKPLNRREGMPKIMPNLTGKTGQQIQAVTGNDSDAHLDHGRNHVFGCKKREQRADQQKGDQPDSNKPGLKDAFIRTVIFVV
jgi:hypothetical protein